MPAGDSILLGGWDGILSVRKGNAFVPTGASVWEFGTNKETTKKANAEYKKRSSRSRGVTESKTAFVFVTSRTFGNRDAWVRGKSRRTKWKRVRAINAADLEAWLAQSQAVHRWFARIVGKRPAGAWDLDQAWAEWKSKTKPASVEDLAIAGRGDVVEELSKRLSGPPSLLRVHGESEEEAYAFVLAALRKRPMFGPMVLTVRSAHDWDELIDSQQKLILIPRLKENRTVGLAVDKGHHVILVESAHLATVRESALTLGPARRQQQITALKSMSLTEEVAAKVVDESRGYLTVIRRHAALAPTERERPDWASGDDGALLTAAMLAGSWRADRAADRVRLAHLSGLSYEAFETVLHRYAVIGDPPVRLVGNVWHVVSRQDAWTMLSPYVNQAVLDRLGDVVLPVLQESDPRFELPPDERWMASVKGKELNHSNELRTNLAEGLAMVGVYGDRDCRNVGSHSVQDRVSGWIYRLLGDEADALRWRSLAPLLPSLAEATPETYLERVEEASRGPSPLMLSLFEDQGDWGGCLHSGLLWSLELLSWHPDFLARVARVLAKLSDKDQGGRWANRPARSLAEIFLGWFPQTLATLEERLAVIDNLLTTENRAGWKLLLGLLPQRGGGTATPIHTPTFHGWTEGWKSGTTRAEYFRHIEKIAERVLDQVDQNPAERWRDVIVGLPQLPRPLRETGWTKLERLTDEVKARIDRKAVSDALREIVSRHRAFADADWSLPKEEVDRIELIYDRLLPADLIEQNKHLFDDHLPDIINPADIRNYEAQRALAASMRNAAVEKIVSARGVLELKRLAELAEAPGTVGEALARSSLAKDVESTVLAWLDSPSRSLLQAAHAFIFFRAIDAPTWPAEIVQSHRHSWNDTTSTNFALGLPFGAMAFELLKQLTEGAVLGFWKRVQRYFLQPNDIGQAEFVLRQLLTAERPLAAIDAAANYLHFGARKAGLSSDVLAQVLEQAATRAPNIEDARVQQHDFIEVIRSLQAAKDLERERMARIEWMYIHQFRFNDISPVTLIDHLFEEPAFFVHLISQIFKSDAPESQEGEPLEERQQRARNAYELLGIIERAPGQSGDDVNEDKLTRWVMAAREGCAASGRAQVGDSQIGQLLAYCPSRSDGIWPHEALRELLEVVDSEVLERGLAIGRYNMRGVTWRSPGDGGLQERDLAAKYRADAVAVRQRWPRTAGLLNRMARTYGRDADREDRGDLGG